MRPNTVTGYPAPDVFPWTELESITAQILAKHDGNTLQYGATRGYRPLIEHLLAHTLKTRGIAATLDNVIITSGSQQGLDLVSRVLISPGDVVLVELPAYTGAIAAFKNIPYAAQPVAEIERVGERVHAGAVGGVHRMQRLDGERHAGGARVGQQRIDRAIFDLQVWRHGIEKPAERCRRAGWKYSGGGNCQGGGNHRPVTWPGGNLFFRSVAIEISRCCPPHTALARKDPLISSGARCF